MKFKQLSPWIPEIYILLSVIFYWGMTGALLNPIAFALVAILATFLWLQNRSMGIVIASVFLLLNLYMILAMISELNEFSTFNSKALQLLLFGSFYLGLNIFLSVKMLIKWTGKIIQT